MACIEKGRLSKNGSSYITVMRGKKVSVGGNQFIMKSCCLLRDRTLAGRTARNGGRYRRRPNAGCPRRCGAGMKAWLSTRYTTR